MFRYKHLLLPLLCSDIIYKSSCSGCNATYYGKTTRFLLNRCNEHVGLNKSGKKHANPSPSSIGEQIKNTRHNASLDDFYIISKTSNSFDPLPPFMKVFLFKGIEARLTLSNLQFPWYFSSPLFFLSLFYGPVTYHLSYIYYPMLLPICSFMLPHTSYLSRIY